MAARALFGWVAASVFSVAATAQAPKAGTVFRECTGCPEMVVLPAGSFTMVSPGHEAERDDDEEPQRVVTVRQPFALGRYEVTRGQFAAFVRRPMGPIRPLFAWCLREKAWNGRAHTRATTAVHTRPMSALTAPTHLVCTT